MSLLDRARPATEADPPLAAVGLRGALGAVGAIALVAAVLVVVAGWHLTQGTTGVGAGELLRLATGRGDDATWDVLVGSRLPRMLAGLIVGVALGAAGAIFQSLARNALASPDTLAVNSGAFFAVTLVAAFNVTLPLFGNSLVAFLGALAAAGSVLLLAGGGSSSTTRLILAGSAIALALDAGAGALLLLFSQETTGLFAWGRGTLSQTGLEGVQQMGPLVAVALLLSLLLSRRLDLLGLGDDTARVLGVSVRRTRVVATVLAVLMCSAAVTLAGPIGFVGLCAPAAVRLVRHVVPSVGRHIVLVPLSALTGALIVLLADALMRQALGEGSALAVPTGVTTTLLGGVVLVVLARRTRDAGPTRRPPSARVRVSHSRLRFLVVLALLTAMVVGALLLGLMAGYTWLLVGDLANWVSDNAVTSIDFAMDERTPRVVAALLGGAALALAGVVIQAVCRNPLAEPGLLGITGGAGVGAVIVVTSTPGIVSSSAIALAAGAGSLVAFAAVYALTWRGGLDSDRLVLVGIGVWSLASATSALPDHSLRPVQHPEDLHLDVGLDLGADLAAGAAGGDRPRGVSAGDVAGAPPARPAVSRRRHPPAGRRTDGANPAGRAARSRRAHLHSCVRRRCGRVPRAGRPARCPRVGGRTPRQAAPRRGAARRGDAQRGRHHRAYGDRADGGPGRPGRGGRRCAVLPLPALALTRLTGTRAGPRHDRAYVVDLVSGGADRRHGHGRAAVAMGELDRWPLGVGEVVVAPLGDRDHHGVEVQALLGEAVLVARALAGLLVDLHDLQLREATSGSTRYGTWVARAITVEVRLMPAKPTTLSITRCRSLLLRETTRHHRSPLPVIV